MEEEMFDTTEPLLQLDLFNDTDDEDDDEAIEPTDEQYECFWRALFDAIYDGVDISTPDEWADVLVSNYFEDIEPIIDCDDPHDFYATLSDYWDTMDYEDPRTGICLTYSDWAHYFANYFSRMIYDELIEAKNK